MRILSGYPPLLIVIFFGLILTAGLVLYLYIIDILRWRKALRKEFECLSEDIVQYLPEKINALKVIERQCLNFFIHTRQLAVEPFLMNYIRSIAVCFKQKTTNPEMCFTLSELFVSVKKMTNRYDAIRSRPGFEIISNLSLREIRYLSGIVMMLTSPGEQDTPTITSIGVLVLNFRKLLLLRYLVTDLLLFIGKLAIAVYSGECDDIVLQPELSIRDTLEDLSRMDQIPPYHYSDHIIKIRESLVGMPGVLWKDPDISMFKNALEDAALIISTQYFPSSQNPVEEFRIGPALFRIREYMGSFCDKSQFSLPGRLFHIRLETLLNSKTITDAIVPSKLKDILVKTQKDYGWLKWPLKVYLLTSKGIFWKMAADAGWFAGRKAILVMMFGNGFDKAVHEMSEIYRLSSVKK